MLTTEKSSRYDQLEKKTIKGSFVIEKTVGIESTAKIKSVNSMMISTRNKGGRL